LGAAVAPVIVFSFLKAFDTIESMAVSATWYEARHRALQWITEAAQPYRNTRGWPYRLLLAAHTRMLRHTDRADRTFIEKIQVMRLRRVLSVAEKAPWWKDQLAHAGITARSLSGIKDLERLPVTSKYSFIGVDKKLLATRTLPRRRVIHQRTSGTTGVPFEWEVDKNIFYIETFAYLQRAISWFGASAERYPFIVSTVHASYPVAEFFWSPIDSDAEEHVASMVKKMQEERLQVMFSYPTNLLLFARHLERHDLRAPLRLAVTTGQRLEDADRTYIEQVLGCPVVCGYGSREMGFMAVECPKEKGRYHINAERLIVEITDEDGKTLPHDKEGFITFTSLDSFYMPLLRYQIGDRGKLLSKPCSCGRTLPHLEFTGRSADFIRMPGGGFIPFRHINSVIFASFFDLIELYQVEQTAPDHLVFRLKLKGMELNAFERIFLPSIRTTIGDALKISFEYPTHWRIEPGRKMATFLPLR
jgi:phenylacetate-CoA ligase